MDLLDGKSVLVTGGTGSFGKNFIEQTLQRTKVRRVVVFSRDELKQFEMQQGYAGESRIRFFLGDVRDRERLIHAFHGIDVVIHAAALKQVPAAEYNPFEAVRTNIGGAENVINAAIDQGVNRVIALSTDKASSPVNLYGATKFVSDKVFVDGNCYAGGTQTRMSVVRYGNVVGSRGSVIPFFLKHASSGKLPITDARMTRFWITLAQGVDFVRRCLEEMQGGEIFVPKIPSMRVTDLAKVIAPDAELEIVGIRPGEKLHEEMISVTDARRTLDMGDYYVIKPDFEWGPDRVFEGDSLPEGFSYTSDANTRWLSEDELRTMVKELGAS